MPGKSAISAFVRGSLLEESALSGAFLPGVSPGLLPIFLIFVKIGAMVFPVDMCLLEFLHADLVERHAWLTQQQPLDAVAVGQLTPGPVFTTANFLGYLLHGTPGAIVATIGIFLPAFVLVALSAPLISKIRASLEPRSTASTSLPLRYALCHLATGAVGSGRLDNASGRRSLHGGSIPFSASQLRLAHCRRRP
jgi:hypothetical protein